MAVTVRGSLVSGQAAGTSSGNFVISTPSSTVAGDYLIILLSTNKDTVTPPSGWTLLQNGQAASLAWQSFVYGRVAPASGTQTFTWNLSNTTAAPNVAVCWALGNVDTSHIVSAKSAEDSTSPVSTPSITTTVPSLCLHMLADRRGSTPSLTWTFPAGYTKTEGTNDGSVGYTVTGAPGSGTVAAGTQSGISLTASANPSTSYGYQVALGDALVAVPAGDISSNIIENASVSASVPVGDTGAGTDTAFVKVPLSVADTGSGTESATVLVADGDAGASSEAVGVVSGGSTIKFGSDSAVGSESVAPMVIQASDALSVADTLQTATVGIEGPYPYGPRVVYVMPSPEG